MYAGPGFYKSLSRQRQCNGLTDIYQGNVYQELSLESGPLSKNTNISLTLNTDGVLVYESTNCSMWPVLLMINELPFTARLITHGNYMCGLVNFYNRRNPKNIILAGLWFSTEKPPMQIFFEPIIEMLLQLETTG